MRSAIKLAAFLLLAPSVRAADVRYYEENGVTYQETRYKVQHPVTETQYEPQARTVYRPQVASSLQDVVRTYRVPVTEYRAETYIHGRWNPFVRQPYLAQRVVPVTRWEMRAETTKVPVTQQQLVAETSTVHVPVTRSRIVEEEVTSRVAVSQRPPSQFIAATAAPGQTTASLAGQPASVPTAGTSQVGGVLKLDQDPPRVGASTAWRPADTTRR